MENIRVFYLKIFHFLVEKFSRYLNRRVFVMVGCTFQKVHFLPCNLQDKIGGPWISLSLVRQSHNLSSPYLQQILKTRKIFVLA